MSPSIQRGGPESVLDVMDFRLYIATSRCPDMRTLTHYPGSRSSHLRQMSVQAELSWAARVPSAVLDSPTRDRGDNYKQQPISGLSVGSFFFPNNHEGTGSKL